MAELQKVIFVVLLVLVILVLLMFALVGTIIDLIRILKIKQTKNMINYTKYLIDDVDFSYLEDDSICFWLSYKEAKERCDKLNAKGQRVKIYTIKIQVT